MRPQHRNDTTSFIAQIEQQVLTCAAALSYNRRKAIALLLRQKNEIECDIDVLRTHLASEDDPATRELLTDVLREWAYSHMRIKRLLYRLEHGEGGTA